jgi:NADH dehydrogenase FAD-containing subunit
MKKSKIVIAGRGFAGLYAAKHFDKHLACRAGVEVTLISRENFILFHADAARRRCRRFFGREIEQTLTPCDVEALTESSGTKIKRVKSEHFLKS